MAEPTLTELVERMDARRVDLVERFRTRDADYDVLERFARARGRRPFDMAGGRRTTALMRLERELTELRGSIDRSFGHSAQRVEAAVELTPAGAAIRQRAAFARLAASLIRPSGVTDAVIMALEEVRVELGIGREERPRPLERALNGAIPIRPAGRSRARGR